MSKSCHSESPQTWWLKTTEMCPLTILEAISLKSRCQQDCTPFGGIREGSLLTPPSCWWPQVSFAVAMYLRLCFHLPMTLSLVSMASPLLVRTFVTRFGAHIDNLEVADLIPRSLIRSAKRSFSKEGHTYSFPGGLSFGGLPFNSVYPN